MAIQDIIDKIKNDAQNEAKKLKAENAAKIDEINAQAAKEVKNIEASAAELAKKKYDEEKRLKVSLATLEQKNRFLATKQKLISRVFDDALIEVKKLPDEKYTELLIKAISQVDLRGDEEVVLGAHDFDKFGSKFVDQLNAAFTKNGKKGAFKLVSEKREGITGCVLRDGRKETICTFESIIDSKRKELEKAVVSLLFKE